MRKTATELEIEIPGKKIVEAKVRRDGTCKIILEDAGYEDDTPPTIVQKGVFVKIEASKLKMADRFLRYKPRTEEQKELKEMIERAILTGIKDFWIPKFAPSFNRDGTEIYYLAGRKPAVGKSYNWWVEKANQFAPIRKSRLGTKLEYAAFLGVLIKKLTKRGWSFSEAWYAVCNDSKKLGHYWNSEDSRHDDFEVTGSREVLGFFDLASTYKLLAEDEKTGCVCIACGVYIYYGCNQPLARIYSLKEDKDEEYYGRVGWIVLEQA